MTKRFGLVVLSAVVIAIGLYLFMTVSYPNNVKVVEKEETRDKLEIAYPQIEGLSKGVGEAKFNQAIQEEVEGFAAKLNTPDHSGKISYKVEYNDHHLLSVTLSEMFYVTHAAHPMTYLKAFTINTKTGEFYQLKDMFKQGTEYKEKINVVIEQQITEQKIPLLKPFKGISDNQCFYLSQDGLVVYYQLYEYTPYFYGFPKFTIPYRQISDMMAIKIR